MSSRLPEFAPASRWTRLRTAVNWVNLSTPLGLAIARAGGASAEPMGRGTRLATGYRHAFPFAAAFTVGNVVISKHDVAYFASRPALLRHEDRHCTQYAFVLGVAMLPLYVVSAGVSWVLAGDHSSYNPFERLAGLADGSYPPPTSRLSRRRAPARSSDSQENPEI
jgi:hypothetical protein